MAALIYIIGNIEPEKYRPYTKLVGRTSNREPIFPKYIIATRITSIDPTANNI